MNIQDLPEKLLLYLSCWLTCRDGGLLALTCRKLYYDVPWRVQVLKPSEMWLTLGASRRARASSLRLSRWLRMRVKVYSQIISNTHDVNMGEGKEDVGTGTSSRVVPPLLPSQLAVCAPLPELKLFVAPDQGEKFLAMSQGSIVPDAGPARSSSWANLQQHLAELTLGLHPGRGNAQLGSLGMLTALKMLIISRGRHHPENPRRDLSGEKIFLKLPDLAFLCVSDLQNGELVLACRKLEMAWFLNCKSFQLTMLKDGDLEFLMLQDCKQVRVEGTRFENNLFSLKSLIVSGCRLSGRHILQDVGHMNHMERLVYTDFPAACMPRSFPESLQSITLSPLDRDRDLPRGLKELTNLTELTLSSDRMSWDFNVSLAELLPLDSLKILTLGSSRYVRQGKAGKATFKRC